MSYDIAAVIRYQIQDILSDDVFSEEARTLAIQTAKECQEVDLLAQMRNDLLLCRRMYQQERAILAEYVLWATEAQNQATAVDSMLAELGILLPASL